MPESPELEIAELKAEVAALSAVVAALFASNMNQNSVGVADHLTFYADAIGRAAEVDPERLASAVDRITRQAGAASDAFGESH